MQARPLTQPVQRNAARHGCGMHSGKHIGTGEHVTASCQTGGLIWKADSDDFSRADPSCNPRASSGLSAPRGMAASSTVREPNGPSRLNETTNRADTGARGKLIPDRNELEIQSTID